MTDGGATPDCKRLRREDAVIELSPQRALNRSTSPPRSPPRTHRSPSPSRTTAAAHPEQAKLVADLSATYGMPMPAELATVWVIAKKEKAKAPLEAFTSLGVRLVGPFEVLSGDLASNMDVHMHWRYAHDTPEMMTILTDSTTNRPSKHWCYHRDSPADLPTMVVLARQSMLTTTRTCVVVVFGRGCSTNPFSLLSLAQRRTRRPSKVTGFSMCCCSSHAKRYCL